MAGEQAIEPHSALMPVAVVALALTLTLGAAGAVATSTPRPDLTLSYPYDECCLEGYPIRELPQRNTITVAPSGAAMWNGVAIDDLTLSMYLRMTTELVPHPDTIIRFDHRVKYPRARAIFKMARDAGIGKVGSNLDDTWAPTVVPEPRVVLRD